MDLEVTLAAARLPLGLPSQRQWSKAATTRTTPVLFGLFSLVCLIAVRRQHPTPLAPYTTAWYTQSELTCSDWFTSVRTSLWRSR